MLNDSLYALAQPLQELPCRRLYAALSVGVARASLRDALASKIPVGVRHGSTTSRLNSAQVALLYKRLRSKRSYAAGFTASLKTSSVQVRSPAAQ